MSSDNTSERYQAAANTMQMREQTARDMFVSQKQELDNELTDGAITVDEHKREMRHLRMSFMQGLMSVNVPSESEREEKNNDSDEDVPARSNKIQCKLCLYIIESTHLHDYKRCKCGACAVDGGKVYQRVVGDPENYIVL